MSQPLPRYVHVDRPRPTQVRLPGLSLWIIGLVTSMTVLAPLPVLGQTSELDCAAMLELTQISRRRLSFSVTSEEYEAVVFEPEEFAEESGPGVYLERVLSNHRGQGRQGVEELHCLNNRLSLVRRVFDNFYGDEERFEPPLPILEVPARSGRRWQWSGDWVFSALGGEVRYPASARIRVQDAEYVETQAGRFQAFLVSIEMRLDNDPDFELTIRNWVQVDPVFATVRRQINSSEHAHGLAEAWQLVGVESGESLFIYGGTAYTDSGIGALPEEDLEPAENFGPTTLDLGSNRAPEDIAAVVEPDVPLSGTISFANGDGFAMVDGLVQSRQAWAEVELDLGSHDVRIAVPSSAYSEIERLDVQDARTTYSTVRSPSDSGESDWGRLRLTASQTSTLILNGTNTQVTIRPRPRDSLLLEAATYQIQLADNTRTNPLTAMFSPIDIELTGGAVTPVFIDLIPVRGRLALVINGPPFAVPSEAELVEGTATGLLSVEGLGSISLLLDGAPLTLPVDDLPIAAGRHELSYSDGTTTSIVNFVAWPGDRVRIRLDQAAGSLGVREF